TDVTRASTALPNCKLFDLTYSNNDVPAGSGSFSDTQLAVSFISKGFTSQSQIDVVVDAFETFMDSKGKGAVS
ncbi:MAG TPA: hypothetical protein PLV65_05335, partial [Tenuifilaceae bacterium]|nr:hypothetical protein [Tenuifilaceae bacterium]